MFDDTRTLLVKEYMIMLAAILTSTIIVLYLFFVFSIYYQQKELVNVFAHEESEEWYNALKYLPNVMPNEQDDNNLSNDLFYYAYDAFGQCIGQHKSSDELAFHVEETIAAQNINNGKVRFKLFFNGNLGKMSAYIITKKEIYDDGEKIGELYAGKNVLVYFEFIVKAFFFVIAFILCVIIFSAYIAKKMANRAMIPIRQSFQRQKDFTADASHELRTPLSVILASVETIERDNKNSLTEFSQMVLIDLKQEVQYMRKITENLLTLARMENCQEKVIQLKPVSINELLMQIGRIFQSLAAEKSIQLEIRAEEKYFVLADANQLLQVLKNLTDNAIKYTAAGGHIWVSVVRENKQQIKIAVTDNGGGIAPEDCAMLFERFFRVDKTRSRQSGGAGLGLSIAKELVKANGGTIYVESEVGKGTSFIIQLPCLNKE